MGNIEDVCSIVNMLLLRNADVFSRCLWTSMTALHYASYFDVSPVVEILLKASKASGK